MREEAQVIILDTHGLFILWLPLSNRRQPARLFASLYNAASLHLRNLVPSRARRDHICGGVSSLCSEARRSSFCGVAADLRGIILCRRLEDCNRVLNFSAFLSIDLVCLLLEYASDIVKIKLGPTSWLLLL